MPKRRSMWGAGAKARKPRATAHRGGGPARQSWRLSTRRRLVLVALGPTMLLLASLGIAGYLQIYRADVFAREASRNYSREITLDDSRGEILDRNGGLLATSVSVDSIYADPMQVQQPVQASERLAEILGLDPADVFERLTRKRLSSTVKRDVNMEQALEIGRLADPAVEIRDVDGRLDVVAHPRKIAEPSQLATLLAGILDMEPEQVTKALTRKMRFVYLARRVPAETARLVEALAISGVALTQESRRYYPKKQLAGQVLGFVGMEQRGSKDHRARGHEGVEAAFDAQLVGNRAVIPAMRDTLGRTTFFKDIPRIPRFAGNTLVLTIDEKIQAYAERALEQAVVTSRALSGMAVVMDVTTGEILAMANVPRFNPNNFEQYPYERMLNRTVRDYFEPGSTFKVLTLAAALDLGVVSLDDIVDVEKGYYRLGAHRIHDTHPHDALPVWDIVKYSSNIGFAKLGELMGRDLVDKYLRDFGVGHEPGTGLPGEACGDLPPVQDWVPITFANICFGQGVSLSALQLVRAVAAVGNHGQLMRPILVKELRDSNGVVLARYNPYVEREVVSPEAAELTLAALARVLEPGGTGAAARSVRYSAAGKTGTAQKADRLLGGYLPHAWIASFVGVAPLEAPRIAVLVVVDEPLGKAYGGSVAGPVFRDITDWTLTYLEVPPSYAQRPKASFVRNGTGATVLRARSAETPTAAAVDAPSDGAPWVYVPDFRGLPLRKARARGRESRLHARLHGDGIAAQQRPLPGERVPSWTGVDVWFQPPETAQTAATPGQ